MAQGNGDGGFPSLDTRTIWVRPFTQNSAVLARDQNSKVTGRLWDTHHNTRIFSPIRGSEPLIGALPNVELPGAVSDLRDEERVGMKALLCPVI